MKLKTFIALTTNLVVIGSPLVASDAAAKKSSCANQPTKAVKACIWQAAKKYRQPYGDALRVASCESTLNPYAQGMHLGLFQFLPSTWQTTPYSDKDALKAKWNALAAMWAWSVGRRGEWECR